MSSEVKKHFKNFLAITTNRSSKLNNWSSFNVRDLTESPVYILVHVPSARSAVFEYFGLLLVENVHAYFCCLENASTSGEISSLEDAIVEIVASIRELIDINSASWLQVVFQWALESLAEISRRFYNRRPVANGSLTDCLKIYTGNKATRAVLDLLNYCVGQLLSSLPEKCVSALLELSAKYGSFCDWVLTYISIIYPKAIINQLVHCGLNDFSSFVFETSAKSAVLPLSQIAQRCEQNDREKLMSLASILSQLAVQQAAELKKCLLSLILEAVESDASQRKQHGLPFLLKLSMFSRDIAELLVMDLEKTFHIKNVIRAAEIFQKLPSDIIFPDKSSISALVIVITSLNNQPHVKLIFEYLCRLVFDSSSLNSVSSDWKYKVQKAANQILDAMLNFVDSQVHNQYALSLEKFPMLQIVDADLYNVVQKMLTERSDGSRFHFKLVLLIALIKGVERASYIMTCILYNAQSNRQLTLFVDFCTVMAPFMVSLSETFILKLQHTLRVLDQQRQFVTPSKKDDKCIWMLNLQKLLDWEKRADSKSEAVCFLNLSKTISNHYCAFVDQLFELWYDFDWKFSLSSSSSSECSTSSKLLTLKVLLQLDPPLSLQLVDAYRIISHCTRSFCDILDQFGYDKTTTLVQKACEHLCDYTLHFLASQNSLTTQAFIKLFFHSLMAEDRWIAIFYDFSKNNATTVDSTNDDVTLMKDNLNLCLKQAAASSLVHSGRIGYGKRLCSVKIEEDAVRSKTAALVGFIKRLCTLNKASIAAGGQVSQNKDLIAPSLQYNAEICREVALKLNEYVCPDALCLEYSVEYNEANIEKYLLVSKRTDRIPFVWDVLLLVAEGYPTLWYTLPILKSVLISIMVKLELSLNKSDKPCATLLATLRKWFCVAHRGKLLAEPFTLMYNVLELVSNYEAFLILSQIWKYLQTTWPELATLDEHFELLLQLDHKLHIKETDSAPYLEPVRLIMQSNISSTGFLYRRLFIT